MNNTNIIYLPTTEYDRAPVLKYKNSDIPSSIKISLYDDNGIIYFKNDTKVYLSARHLNNSIGFKKCTFFDTNNSIVHIPLSNIVSSGCYLECELFFVWYDKDLSPSSLRSFSFYIVSNGIYQEVNTDENTIIIEDEKKEILNTVNENGDSAESILLLLKNSKSALANKKQKLVEFSKRINNLSTELIHAFDIKQWSSKVPVIDNACSYAIVNTLGQVNFSNNLCTTEGEYVGKDVSELVEANNPYVVHINLGELDVGNYYVDLQGVYGGEDGLEITIDDNTDSVFPFYFTVDKKREVHLGIGTPFNGWESEERCILQGKIESLMVYRSNDKDTHYKPHISLGKLAYIRSYSANSELIDTINIPTEILDLEGYGIGKSKNECNYIDFVKKVFVNGYEYIDGIVRAREVVTEIDVSKHLNYSNLEYIMVEENGYIAFFDIEGNNIGAVSEFTFLVKMQ